MNCPVCNRVVESLAANGICRDCPEYKRLQKEVGLNFKVRSRIVQRKVTFLQKPAGRSGKVSKI